MYIYYNNISYDKRLVYIIKINTLLIERNL